MPSKDKAKQAAYQNKHYKQNKEYYKNKRRERQIAMTERYNAFKTTLSCSICNENDPVAIDLHHLDPTVKIDLVHRIVRDGQCWSTVVKEFEKCVALCSNCHRKVHAHEEWANKINETHLIKVPALETAG